MYYITVKLPKMYHQMTLEELFFSEYKFENQKVRNANLTATRTFEAKNISKNIEKRFNSYAAFKALEEFNKRTQHLRSAKREELYTTFKIPKHSGGLRTINAPKEELKTELRNLKTILETYFGTLYHTSAFAYVPGRCNVDALKKHQQNQSRWFFKTDFSDFFGSTTLEFLMSQLSMIFPFSSMMSVKSYSEELEKALELGFLNGGLPQGTPLSPLITNIMMIPIDYRLSCTLRDFDGHNLVYTRYADDILISGKYNFDYKNVEDLMHEVLKEFKAPFIIKPEKTRYGSSSGRNWNLGLMLNQNNEITVGHKRKKQFQTMLYSYVRDKKNGVAWELEDVRSMDGLRSYYHMVEPEAIDGIIRHMNQKLNVDIPKMIREDLILQ